MYCLDTPEGDPVDGIGCSVAPEAEPEPSEDTPPPEAEPEPSDDTPPPEDDPVGAPTPGPARFCGFGGIFPFVATLAGLLTIGVVRNNRRRAASPLN